ncbi:hypothetical protein FHW36_103135 [Chitinophaga polysaccharea]|uniref:Uncharacterized protein n=2 Tax=Chitinophaga polysaccharea TaxID=1293035 RepID=A0A561PT88_9BACT|nr:hypothetical protein FHW36_103135 [Chitinophaga polysaccharea]
MVIAIMIAGPHAFSQQGAADAYWTVETGRHPVIYTIIRFYTPADQLLHTIRINGSWMDPGKAKMQRRIKQIQHQPGMVINPGGVASVMKVPVDSIQIFSATANN